MLKVSLDALQSRAFRMVQPGRTCVFPFGRGSGKTYLLRAMVHAAAMENPGIELGLLYPSLKQARAVIWPGLIADYSGDLKPYVRPPNRTELICEYRNGSRVSTWGAENIDAIRGQRFGRLYQDEADDIDPDVEAAAVQPTFSRSGTNSIWVKSGTPRRGRYGGLYRDFTIAEEQARGDFRDEDGVLVHDPSQVRTHFGFRIRSDQSPQVDQRWLAKVRAELFSKGKKAIYEREYNCNFDAAEGLVYPMFAVDTHVRVPDYGVPFTEILVGVDHGWNDPGVFLVVGVIGNGRDAILHVLEEVYETERDTTWWVDKAAEVAWRYRQYRQRWFADPSRPDRIVDHRKAVRAKHPELGERFTIEEAKNEIEAGVDALADRIATRELEDGTHASRFYIAPSCVNTIREFGLYKRKRDPRNPERVLDEILDKDNHAMDCARYLNFTRFGGPDRRRHEVGQHSQHAVHPA